MNVETQKHLVSFLFLPPNLPPALFFQTAAHIGSPPGWGGELASASTLRAAQPI